MDIRSRRFLVYGVFISLALHLSAGSLIRITPVPEPVESSLPFVMETAQPRPMPTPPPTPKPTPPRAPPPKPARTQPTLPPQIRIITPHVTPRADLGSHGADHAGRPHRWYAPCRQWNERYRIPRSGYHGGGNDTGTNADAGGMRASVCATGDD